MLKVQNNKTGPLKQQKTKSNTETMALVILKLGNGSSNKQSSEKTLNRNIEKGD